MKKISQLITVLLAIIILTGCGCTKKEEKKKETKPKYDENASVVKDQVFTGLEFVNIGIGNGKVDTSVINNTGVVYESSTFTIKVQDEQGKVIVELKGTIDKPIKDGETRVVSTPTTADLTKAYSIEYSVN